MPIHSGGNAFRLLTTHRRAAGPAARRAGYFVASALCVMMLTGGVPEANASVVVDPAVVQASVAGEEGERTAVNLRDLGLRGSDHSFDAAAGAPRIPTFTLREIAVTVVLLVIGGLVALLGIGAHGDGDGYDQL